MLTSVFAGEQVDIINNLTRWLLWSAAWLRELDIRIIIYTNTMRLL